MKFVRDYNNGLFPCPSLTHCPNYDITVFCLSGTKKRCVSSIYNCQQIGSVKGIRTLNFGGGKWHKFMGCCR